MDGNVALASAMRAANARADVARTRFEIAPAELVAIVSEARGLGLEIAGFYHSHPDHAAQCSATDLAEAHWLGCCYVITEVIREKPHRPALFFLLGDGEEEKRFEPLALDIDDRRDSQLGL